jgi:hypothetical protein
VWTPRDPSILPPPSQRLLETGDLDGDGRRDALVLGQSGKPMESAFLLLQRSPVPGGAGRLEVQGSLATNSGFPKGVAIGDMNGDHAKDALIIDTDMELKVYLQKAEGTFDALPAHLHNVYDPTAWVEAGDLNADGRDDCVVVAGSKASEMFFFYQSPTGAYLGIEVQNQDQDRYPPNQTFHPPNKILGLAIADVNGDGRNDLVGLTGSELLLYFAQ